MGTPIIRNDGVTPAERYLKTLCDSTFLSLWSYPGVFRDQRINATTEGKEVCDLLVVFERDVIIFSDKHCAFRSAPDIATAWSRWFRKAVVAGTKQLWGAERWISEHPDRLFLDRACSVAFPLDVPVAPRFHLVLVTHGVSRACQITMGGSGSLMINTDLRGVDAHTIPFTIGDLDPTRKFVHVFDDTTLDVVLTTLDTISDFTSYLRKKERLFRGKRAIFASGEEDVLGVYFTTLNESGEHDFVIADEATDAVLIGEGHWADFENSWQRRSQLEHDQISYSWDKLIETFNNFALKGEQYLKPANIGESELILRFLAREPRTRRRMLAEALLTLIRDTPADQRGTRVLTPSRPGDPHYALLTLPIPPGMAHREYRELRGGFLDALLRVVKLKYPAAENIVGIATESGLLTEPRTEDAAFLDTRDWCEEAERDAKECQKTLGLLLNTRERYARFHEFPAVSPTGSLIAPLPRNPRNKPCPCGSGVKFKKCHGA